MQQYNIEEADVGIEEDASVEQPELQEYGEGKKTATAWRGRLGIVVASAFGCAVRWKRSGYPGHEVLRLAIAGRPSDIAACKLALDFCHREIGLLTSRHAKGLGRTFANNFRLGCIDAVRKAIKAEQDDLKTQMAETVKNSSALVVVENRVAEAKQAFRISYGRGRSNARYDRDGREAGRHFGSTIWTGTKKRVSA